MNILILDWNSFAHEYVAEEFRNLDCTVEYFPWPFGKENMRENMELCAKLKECLNNQEYDFAFSFNFFPVAAKTCNECGVKYVSWIYDMPYMLLYSKYTKLETNHIFFFDKALCMEFRKNGIENTYYMPLAAPVGYYDSLRESAENKYISEISFVGSVYQEEQQDFYKYLKEMNHYTSGYLRAIMAAQKDLYGDFILEKLLDENILGELRRVCPIEKEEDEWETDAWIYANYFLARKLTGEQRAEILNLIAGKYPVRLYTADKISGMDKVEICGPVDYVSEMPYVFKNTKINLNMTLRSIWTGIPLRAMDIMGCGGFLLTNYQADFLDYFEPGIDYVYYADNNDLMRKIDYYLTHEDERKSIAESGYRKVKMDHTYADRVQMIIEHIKEL